jgi:putative transferase (TIGR04331 family)
MTLKNRLKLEPYVCSFIQNIYGDSEDIGKANTFVQDQYSFFIDEVSSVLNLIHHVNYPISFWEVIVGFWLFHYLHALYDRYLRLKAALSKFDIGNIRLLVQKTEITPASSFFQFIIDTSEDEKTASAFYGKIAELLHIKVKEFSPMPKENFEPAGFPLKKAKKIPHYNRLLCSLINKAIRKTVRAKILMACQSVDRFEEVLLSCYLRARFFPNKIKNTKNNEKREVARDALLKISGENEFQKIAINLMPLYMPTYLLEEFHAYSKSAQRWKDYQVYYASQNWYGNVNFAYSAAFGRLRGAKLVAGQHGGGYGQYEFEPSEYIETRIFDYYFTWGWMDSPYRKDGLLPMPDPKLSRIANRYRYKRDIAVWVGTTMQNQMVRICKQKPGTYLEYIEDKSRFIENIPKEIRSKTVYRPHRIKCGWSREELDVFKRFPEVDIQHEGEFSAAIKDIKLLICDHQGTTFLESLVMNTPTILFWRQEVRDERKSAVPFYDSLRAAGILFHDPVAAARQINLIWNDIVEWWGDESRQDARRRFIEHFCLADRKWKKKWAIAFEHIRSEVERKYHLVEQVSKSPI